MGYGLAAMGAAEMPNFLQGVLLSEKHLYMYHFGFKLFKAKDPKGKLMVKRYQTHSEYSRLRWYHTCIRALYHLVLKSVLCVV